MDPVLVSASLALLVVAVPDRAPCVPCRSFFFFGGLSIHLSQALLAHLFSYNIQWGATKKEVERSNFWLEIPKILKRFWIALVISLTLAVAMIIFSTSLMPPAWQIPSWNWAVIFPLAIVIGCHVLFPVSNRRLCGILWDVC